MKKDKYVKVTYKSNYLFKILQNCITIDEFQKYYCFIIQVLTSKKKQFNLWRHLTLIMMFLKKAKR